MALARWDTGDAAVVRSNLGQGRVYVFGWRLRHILTEAERQIVHGEEPHGTNTLLLGADICRLLVRGAYEGWAGENAQIRQFAPEGKQAALIVTHDVGFSYEWLPEYAHPESARGLTSTFLFTTSPAGSGFAGTLYDAYGLQDIQQALDLGHDIQSHSFGHFPDFDHAPFGSGTETASNYMPRYSSHLDSTIGMSVLGELGVSRWLLESDFGITVESFRSGFLFIPDGFWEGLSRTGYRRDSTYASGLTRGSFPFVAFSVSSGAVTTYPIMEYPLGISDSDMTEETFTQLLDAWEYVVRANYNNSAPTVLLIHPTSAPTRQRALEELLLRVADLDLWIGDWKTFAEFWEAQGVTCERWP